MSFSVDFSLASSQQIESALGERIKQIRLAKNISQLQLAKDAGISRDSIERMEKGSGISLNIFIRVLVALNVQNGLETVLPDMSVRPIDRVKMMGEERKRASQKKKKNDKNWNWNE